MKNYALELLRNALRDELIAREQGSQIMNGSMGYYNDSGRQAFIESYALAEERIPQLEDAIKKVQL